MEQTSAEERANKYCEERFTVPDFANLLGTGQEGSVWPTERGTAIKVFDRLRNFKSERDCYEILARNSVFELDGFTIPHLIDSDETLLVVEMSIVSPPFILDFGKAYVDRRPDFDNVVLEYYDEERSKLFVGNWDLVQKALFGLERFGIFYWDARPGNIDCRNHPLATSEPGSD